MLMELEAPPNEVSLTLLSSPMEKVEKTKMRTLDLPESDEHLPLLQFGEFTLDRQQLALYRGQQTVHLTGKAFRTLVLLVVNRGKTLSRDALLDSVWADVCVTPNTVDHAVAEIRHALNDHQEPTRFIRTIPREGYCFIAEVREMMLQPSLAILPFSTLGLESSGERVSVGLADALITRLCNLNNSLVCPTAAVLRYAGNARDPLKAGRELGADFVLEGLIQKAGEPVRITLQLIRVCDGKPLWAETFDETFTSIFALEDAFVQKVIQALPSPFGLREGRKADASGIGRSEL